MSEPLGDGRGEAGSGGLNFVALDVETANSQRGSICAIGLVVVRGGRVLERHGWLVRPPKGLQWFDAFSTALHGIGPGDVADAPTFTASLQRLTAVIGDLPVIAHNAAFDIGALRDACDAEGLAWPSLRYGCSLVMARRELALVSYRLPLVADALGIDLHSHHDAAADAEAAAQIVLALAARRRATTLIALAGELMVLLGQLSANDWRGCQRAHPVGGSNLVPPGANPDADPGHPMFGQVTVFTGALGIRREDAWAQVAALGGVVEANVTKRTNLLVVGDGFAGDDPTDFWTGKAAKAIVLRAKGQNIEVVTERELLRLLCETTTGTRRPSRTSGQR